MRRSAAISRVLSARYIKELTMIVLLYWFFAFLDLQRFVFVQGRWGDASTTSSSVKRKRGGDPLLFSHCFVCGSCSDQGVCVCVPSEFWCYDPSSFACARAAHLVPKTYSVWSAHATALKHGANLKPTQLDDIWPAYFLVYVCVWVQGAHGEFVKARKGLPDATAQMIMLQDWYIFLSAPDHPYHI